MNYYAIGQRIRKFRKAMGLSQETLSEQVGISVTHMSHIETGNTKLSLPVLVALAQTLEVKTDDLLFDQIPEAKSDIINEISQLLTDCSVRELQILKEVLHTTKTALKKY